MYVYSKWTFNPIKKHQQMYSAAPPIIQKRPKKKNPRKSVYTHRQKITCISFEFSYVLI